MQAKGKAIRHRRCLLAIVLVSLTACVGGRVRIVAEGDPVGPISLTDTVFGPRGRSLEIGEGLELVRSFERSERFTSIFYGLSLSEGLWDVTEEINRLLAENEADAVLNLRVEAEPGSLTWLSTVLPFVPATVDVTLRGDLVRSSGSDLRARRVKGAGAP